MNERVFKKLPWMVLSVIVGMTIVGAAVLKRTLTADDVFGVPFLAFAVVGALVAWRQPHNPVGWIFLLVGFSPTVGFFTGSYAYRSMLTQGSLPATTTVEWISSWAWFPGIGALITFGLLLFPDGRVPSRRWKVVPYLAGGLLAIVTMAMAFVPGPMEPFDPTLPSNPNPYGLQGLGAVLGTVEGISFSLFPVMGLLCASSLAFRYRAAGPEQRQQIKWFAYSALLLVIIMIFENVISRVGGEGFADVVFLIGMTFPSVGAGIAILKYRLYDIDLVVNRTLVYLALTAILVGVYLATVVTLQQLLAGITADSDLAVAASTLAVAALFRPLRSRVQTFIDHRFYRRRYDATETLRDFSARLRDQVDLDSLTAQVINVVSNTIQPAHASLWLRPKGGG